MYKNGLKALKSRIAILTNESEKYRQQALDTANTVTTMQDKYQQDLNRKNTELLGFPVMTELRNKIYVCSMEIACQNVHIAALEKTNANLKKENSALQIGKKSIRINKVSSLGGMIVKEPAEGCEKRREKRREERREERAEKLAVLKVLEKGNNKNLSPFITLEKRSQLHKNNDKNFNSILTTIKEEEEMIFPKSEHSSVSLVSTIPNTAYHSEIMITQNNRMDSRFDGLDDFEVVLDKEEELDEFEVVLDKEEELDDFEVVSRPKELFYNPKLAKKQKGIDVKKEELLKQWEKKNAKLEGKIENNNRKYAKKEDNLDKKMAQFQIKIGEKEEKILEAAAKKEQKKHGGSFFFNK